MKGLHKVIVQNNRLAMELGFINATGKMRLTHANEIVQHYLERDVMEEMPQNESDSVILNSKQGGMQYEQYFSQNQRKKI